MIIVKTVDEVSYPLEYQRMQSTLGNKVHFALSKDEKNIWIKNLIKTGETKCMHR